MVKTAAAVHAQSSRTTQPTAPAPAATPAVEEATPPVEMAEEIFPTLEITETVELTPTEGIIPTEGLPLQKRSRPPSRPTKSDIIVQNFVKDLAA